MDKGNTENMSESQNELLKQVKAQADEVKRMHKDMQAMLEACKSIKSEFDVKQQEKIQDRMLKLAKKSAKKAAKKSIAKAQIKERLYLQNDDTDSND